MKYRMLAAVFTIHPLVALAQNACSAQLVPLKPTSVNCSNAVPVCVMDQNGINGHWAWGCPAQPPPNPPVDFSTLNQGVTKQESPMDAYQRGVQLRQQREAMRQQTESLAGGNITVPGVMIPTAPEFPLATAYASMPSPTGKKKQDQKNWDLWLKQNPLVSADMPPWSPSAYEQVRKMAAAQITAGH